MHSAFRAECKVQLFTLYKPLVTVDTLSHFVAWMSKSLAILIYLIMVGLRKFIYLTVVYFHYFLQSQYQ